MRKIQNQQKELQRKPGSRFFPILRVGRFRFVLGPGTLLALVVGTLFLMHSNRPTPQSPPLIERQIRPFGPQGKEILAPEIPWILRHQEELRLTRSQKQQLEALAQEWVNTTKEQRTSLQRASAEFEAFMKEQKDHRIPIQEIQRRAEPVSYFSAVLSAERRRYWARAKQILTPQQISRVEKLLYPANTLLKESKAPRSVLIPEPRKN